MPRAHLSTLGYWLAWALLAALFHFSPSALLRDLAWLAPLVLLVTFHWMPPVATLPRPARAIGMLLAITALAFLITETYDDCLDVAWAFSWGHGQRVTRALSLVTQSLVTAALVASVFATVAVHTLGRHGVTVLTAVLLAYLLHACGSGLVDIDDWRRDALGTIPMWVDVLAMPSLFLVVCRLLQRRGADWADAVRARVPVTIRQLWSGEATPRLAALVYGGGLTVVIALFFWRVDVIEYQPDGPAQHGAMVVGWVAILMVLYLVSVPAWRCHRRLAGAAGRGARQGLVLVALPFVAMTLFVEGPRTGFYLAPVAEHAIGSAWHFRPGGRPGELRLEGRISYGLADGLREALARHPGTTRLVLKSPGGFVGDAVEAADLIRQRGLTTVVDSDCASACTLLFAAGHERILRPAGRLGFHAGRGPLDSVFGYEDDGFLAAKLAALGVEESFIRQARRTPAEEMWYPRRERLLASGVVTAIEE